MITWKRKLQKTGPGSIGVTLPSAWARTYGLEPQDAIKIYEKEGELILKPND